jgi:hypothetical protein
MYVSSQRIRLEGTSRVTATAISVFRYCSLVSVENASTTLVPGMKYEYVM